MVIRYITPTDIGNMEALDKKCFPDAIRYNRYALDYYLSIPNSIGLIENSENDNELLGFLIAVESSKEIINIVTIDVDPVHRQLGIGTRLINAVKKLLKERGVKKITLQVAIDNKPAINFYLKHGFHIKQKLYDYYPTTDGYEMELNME